MREAAGTLEGFDHEHIALVADLFAPDAQDRAALHLPNGISVERLGDEVYIGSRGIRIEGNRTTSSSSWPTIEPGAIYDVVPGQEMHLDSGWVLSVTLGSALPVRSDSENLTSQFDTNSLGIGSSLVFRTWNPGDHIAPFGLGGTKSLQDLFVDAKIPVHYRRCIPLLAYRDSSEVLWVPGPGGRRSSHAPVGEATESVVRVQFERSSIPEGGD